MKKPCPVDVFVHVIPAGVLSQRKPATAVLRPYASFGAVGTITVSPAQTRRPTPALPTFRPCP
jgi:hypothetical protein